MARKRLRKMESTGETYLKDWKRNTRGYNEAKIELNGYVFDLYYRPPQCGYCGFYGAKKESGENAMKNCREFTKLPALLREIHYQYPREKEAE